MKIANLYSHLNGYEYMLVHQNELWKEIETAIQAINANDHIKLSNDKVRVGKQLYDQKSINKKFEEILFPQDWKSVTTPYYVTGDIQTAREIASVRDRAEQKRIIEGKGFEAYSTNNQVDFVKNRVAVEVQFGKYFSVAYTRKELLFDIDKIVIGEDGEPTLIFKSLNQLEDTIKSLYNGNSNYDTAKRK